jgi:sulfate permease, SulP family
MSHNKFENIIPDLLSGVAIAVASVSTGAAFGILSGRGAFAGIIGTGVIAIIVAILGGTRRQIALPTGTMAAPTALMTAFAYESFTQMGNKIPAEQFITLVMILTGVFLLIGGIFNLGRFVSIIPELVVYGFANGLAGIILINQASRVFGFRGFEWKVGDYRIMGIETGKYLSGGTLNNLLIAIATLVLIFSVPTIAKTLKIPEKVRAIIPASFVSILVMTFVITLVNIGVQKVDLGVQLSSFNDYLLLITNYFPSMEMFTGPLLLKALPWAFQLAIIAYLDTLLTSILLDSITGEKTKRGKELVAQGIANIFSGSLGGILGAQSTVSSLLALKEGMRTRLAGVVTGVSTLIILALFSNLIGNIALAVFTGVLLKVAWDTLDKPFFEAYFVRKWYSIPARNWQLFIILWTTILTIVIDLNVAVISGTILFFLLKKLGRVMDISQKDYDDEVPEMHLQDIPLND